MTDYRALCAELVKLLEVSEEWSGCTQPQALTRARAALAQPEPVLPPNYIDAEHTGQDQELLKVFYKACLSEGGTADEITLRGLKTVLAQPKPVAPTDEELIRPIMWMLDDSIYDNDKGEIAQSLRELVARWGQP